MGQKVTPTMVVVALVVLLVVVFAIYKLTLGKSSTGGANPETDVIDTVPPASEGELGISQEQTPPVQEGEPGIGGDPGLAPQ